LLTQRVLGKESLKLDSDKAMYNDYFGFSESPFNITPNPRFFYCTQSCDEVLQVVRHGIESRKGLLVIVGEPGSGKTLFLKCLVRDFPSRITSIVLQNPQADFDEILRLLVEKLEIPGAGAAERTGRLERLTSHLIEHRRAGRTVCLLIDEAQDLPANTLDDLRLLANLECEGDALLPLVLFGQSELNAKLDEPAGARMKQRVALTRNLYPLIRKEIGPYINARLKVAGYDKEDLFDAEAIDSVAAHSGGIPRMVNALCDNALLRTYTLKERVVSATIVEQVARELRIGSVRPAHAQAAPFPPHRERHERNDAADAEPASATAPLQFDQDEALRQRAVLSALSAAEAAGGSANGVPHAAFGAQLRRYLQRLVGERRLRCYAVAGTIAVLLLGLNIVNSSQRNGASSMFSGRGGSSEMSRGAIDAPAMPQAATGDALPRANGNLAGEKAVASEFANLSRPYTNGAPTAGKDAPREPEPPTTNGTGTPDPPETDAAKSAGKRPVATLEVVGRSKLRAQPSAGSEIIAELEPGDRVMLLSKSRDYYYVRSVEDRAIRGYVHREDAFFENSRSR
jgi:type II secretory pathway predicted ATPase ExeA